MLMAHVAWCLFTVPGVFSNPGGPPLLYFFLINVVYCFNTCLTVKVNIMRKPTHLKIKKKQINGMRSQLNLTGSRLAFCSPIPFVIFKSLPSSLTCPTCVQDVTDFYLRLFQYNIKINSNFKRRNKKWSWDESLRVLSKSEPKSKFIYSMQATLKFLFYFVINFQ